MAFQFNVSRDDLLRAISAQQNITSKKGTLAILANVLLDVRPDHVVLTGTDLEIGLKQTIPAEVFEGTTYKSFATVMYERYCAITGITPNAIPTDKTGRTMINYSGKPGDYEYISMSDVLNGNIDPRVFDDSVVFVGAYDPEML
jgi:hypothetical protein